MEKPSISWELLHGQKRHGEGYEPFEGAKGEDVSEHVPAHRQPHEQSHGEDRDHGHIAGFILRRDLLAEMSKQIIMPSDATAIDEGLRRGFHPVLLLEAVRLFARRQMVVLHRVTIAFKQVLGLQPVGAHMVGHDHAVEIRRFRLFLDCHEVTSGLRCSYREQA